MGRPYNPTRMKNGAAHYSLIIFDLDGTLTRDALDFDALRRPPRT